VVFLSFTMKYLILLAVNFICASVVAQHLQFNEFMLLNSYYYADDGNAYPWVEFVNHSDTTINLNRFYLSSDSLELTKWRLPDAEIPAGGFYLLWFSGTDEANHAAFKIDSVRYLLLSDSSENIYDRTPAVSPVIDESCGRRPNNPDEWIYFTDEAHISPGNINVDTAPWVKVQAQAAFPRGDVGYIGNVVYDNKMWILDYETMDSAGNWLPLPVVWNSDDGINWQQINITPPYCHGAMITVFENYIWAFDGRAFRTKDGITWEQVSSNTPVAERIAVFKDTLWVLDRNALYRSADGIVWETVTESFAWSYRRWPAFLVHNNKLWMYGGNTNYNTGSDFYYHDVWSSDDGIEWKLETDSASWRGGFWFSYLSHDNRLWVIEGGWQYQDRNNAYNGNANDVWVSDDGISWTKIETPVSWYPRHAVFTWVFKNEIWIAGGYAGGGPHHLFNDVWRFSKLQQEVTIPQSLTLDHGLYDLDIFYGDTLDLQTTSGLPVTFVVSDTLVAKSVTASHKAIGVGAGETNVKILLNSNALYMPAEKTAMLRVRKRELLVKAPGSKRIYGDTASFNLDYEGFVLQDDVSILDKTPFVSNLLRGVGLHQVIPEGGEDKRYNFIYETGNLIIEKRDLIVEPVSTEITYGETIPEIYMRYSNFAPGEERGVLDEQPTIKINNLSKSVGKYDITVSGGSDDNYRFVYKPGYLQINKKDVIVEPVSQQITYGDNIPSPELTYSQFVKGDDPSALDRPPTVINNFFKSAGIQAITVSAGEDDNYNLIYRTGYLQIDKKDLVVEPVSQQITYGDNIPSVELTYSGFIEGDDPSALDRPPTPINNFSKSAGIQTVMASAGEDDNYNFIYRPGYLQIDKKNLIVTPVSQQITYGDSIPSIELLYSEFISGDNPFVLDKVPTVINNFSTVAGRQVINLSPGKDDNYNLIYRSGYLQIDKKELVVEPKSIRVLFGELLPEITLNYSGFVNGENAEILDELPVISNLPPQFSAIGTYMLEPRGGADNNYEFVYKNGKLDVYDGVENSLVIAPNPVRSELKIVTSSVIPGKIVLRLVDTHGRLLYTEVFTDFQYTIIDLTDFDPGIYLLQIITSDGLWVKKFVKE
jgi:hypothetical protein